MSYTRILAIVTAAWGCSWQMSTADRTLLAPHFANGNPQGRLVYVGWAYGVDEGTAVAIDPGDALPSPQTRARWTHRRARADAGLKRIPDAGPPGVA